MKFTLIFSVLVTMLTSVAAFPLQEPLGGGLKLQRPKFKKGDIIISKTLVELVDAKVSSPDIPKGDKFNLNRRIRGTLLSEVIETNEGGDISEILESTLVSGNDTRVAGKVGGKEIDDANNERSPLEDTTIRYLQKKGIWVGRLNEGETTKEIADLLDSYLSPDETSLLPKKPLSLGESWTIKGPSLRKFAPEALSFDGSAELTFEKIVAINGRNHALVKGVLEMKLTSLDEDKNEIKSRINCTLNIWVDIQTGIEALGEGKGSMVIEGTFGKIKDAKMAGQLLLNTSQRLLKKP